MRNIRQYIGSASLGQCGPSRVSTAVLGTQARFQSSDKKFHCSICKKSFRLEMAAKLHMQQVHNGDGTIEAGSGPGVESVTPASTTPLAGPPTAPIARDDIDERRRERPTPRPLHQSNYEVPAAAMEAMLGVWDTIGTKRGIEGFIHSSMVLKVYAAKPSGPETAYTNLMPRPEGPNPFEGFEPQVRKVWPDPIPSKRCPLAPFSVATGTLRSVCRSAWITNPYTHRSLIPRREQTKTVKTDEPTEAPVTPFGQLPKFGQIVAPAPVSQPTNAANPFSAAAAAASPFAAAAQAASPFAAAAQAASPFAAAAQAASPFGQPQQSASPFGSAAQTSSPFGASQSAPSPFTAAPSPFTAAPSPFTAAPSPFASGSFESTSPFPPFAGFEAFGMTGFVGGGEGIGGGVAAVDEKKFTCSVCSKAFHTEFALAMHSKQKHNIDMPLVVKDHKRKEKVPDLPAYVPSPVDLAGTSPFGTEPTSPAQRWSDIELIPHALSVNNITIVGVIGEVEVNSPLVVSSSQDVAYISVRVASDESADGFDDFIVQCAKSYLTELSKGTSVCIVGTLRLHPTLDEAANKYYSVPIVHVSESNGVLATI